LPFEFPGLSVRRVETRFTHARGWYPLLEKNHVEIVDSTSHARLTPNQIDRIGVGAGNRDGAGKVVWKVTQISLSIWNLQLCPDVQLLMKRSKTKVDYNKNIIKPIPSITLL